VASWRFLIIALAFCACSMPSGNTSPFGISNATTLERRPSKPEPKATTLVVFSPATTGAYPDSGLTALGTTLFGVTQGQRGYDCSCGTVYALGANGNAMLLHQFAGAMDGDQPSGALTYAKGTLYGVTAYGGGAEGCGSSKLHPLGCGTIYSITPAGIEKILYAFTDVTGYRPSGSVVYLNGKLYGVTPYGVSNQGTIWSFDLKKRTLTQLHKFFQDGAYAEGGLTRSGSTLYGTTSGYLDECPTTQYTCGTVFSIKPSGANYTVLHTFDKTDGASPFAGVVFAGNYLYGTTEYGGKGCSSNGCGTLFSISPNGKFTTLWYFGTHTGDGENPIGNLFLYDGTLYGATQHGEGSRYCESYPGSCGAVFASGTLVNSERVLYALDGSLGVTPGAGVFVRKSKIYGTTLYGGPDHYGTLYRIDGALSNPEATSRYKR
jgi:uncharacterized repeat protein (TIGR03803 family)